MKLDLAALIGPIVALLLLLMIGQQTMGALRGAGAWGGRKSTTAADDDVYARLDRILGARDSALTGLRDPFSYQRITSTEPVVRRPVVKVTATPPPPPAPVLTAIIFDNDPRATVRFNGRDYSVRANTLFADYRVVSIARDQVVLERSGTSVVLKLPTKGD